MKPRLTRHLCYGVWVITISTPCHLWRCEGAGLVADGWTPALAFKHWQEDYNKPWRRFARWLKDLRKEREA